MSYLTEILDRSQMVRSQILLDLRLVYLIDNESLPGERRDDTIRRLLAEFFGRPELAHLVRKGFWPNGRRMGMPPKKKKTGGK